MSRSISSSLNILSTSLSSAKSSLSNKGVSVPSTVKVSGLPALIDKIETVPTEYGVTFRFPDLVGYKFYLRIDGPTYKTLDYTSTRAPSEVTVKLSAGTYDISLGNSYSSKYYKVGTVSVGTNTNYDVRPFYCIFVFDNCDNATGLSINRGAVENTYTRYNINEKFIFAVFKNLDMFINPTVYYRSKSTGDWVQCRLSGNNSFSTLMNKRDLEIPFCVVNTENNTYNIILHTLNGTEGGAG